MASPDKIVKTSLKEQVRRLTELLSDKMPSGRKLTYTTMYYEINVAFKGSHYFATDKRSIQTKEKMMQVYSHFRKLFDGPEWDISITYHPQVGYGVDTETFNIIK